MSEDHESLRSDGAAAPSSPYSPPKADLELALERPVPVDVRFVSRTGGGILFAYSIFGLGLSVVFVFLSGGFLFRLGGSLLGTAIALAGLAAGWRLASGRPAGLPIWVFGIGHALALIAWMAGAHLSVLATR